MRRILIVAGLVALVYGCAESPESVAPSYVSTVPYKSWTCAQLGEEEQRLNAAYSTAAQQQSDARTNDTWGVLLLGLPTASLSGENIAPQIANLKGQLNAVHQTQTLKNCSSRQASPTLAASANFSQSLGITGDTLDSNMTQAVFMPGDPTGVVIGTVQRSSPANKADLRPGDVIKEFNGQRVTSVDDLNDDVSKVAPGSTVPVVLNRQGRILTASVNM